MSLKIQHGSRISQINVKLLPFKYDKIFQNIPSKFSSCCCLYYTKAEKNKNKNSIIWIFIAFIWLLLVFLIYLDPTNVLIQFYFILFYFYVFFLYKVMHHVYNYRLALWLPRKHIHGNAWIVRFVKSVEVPKMRYTGEIYILSAGEGGESKKEVR